jgi:hypothetical protein
MERSMNDSDIGNMMLKILKQVICAESEVEAVAATERKSKLVVRTLLGCKTAPGGLEYIQQLDKERERLKAMMGASPNEPIDSLMELEKSTIQFPALGMLTAHSLTALGLAVVRLWMDGYKMRKVRHPMAYEELHDTLATATVDEIKDALNTARKATNDGHE